MKMGLVFLFLPCLNSLDAAAQTECNTLNVSLKSRSLQDNSFSDTFSSRLHYLHFHDLPSVTSCDIIESAAAINMRNEICLFFLLAFRIQFHDADLEYIAFGCAALVWGKVICKTVLPFGLSKMRECIYLLDAINFFSSYAKSHLLH